MLASCPQEADEDFASAGSEHEQPQADEADGRYDNQDEVEETDHLQHLREAGLPRQLMQMHYLSVVYCLFVIDLENASAARGTWSQ